MISYFCTLQNDHHDKASCHLLPYKVITVLLTTPYAVHHICDWFYKWHVPIIIWAFHTLSWHNHIFQVHLVVPSPDPETTIFPWSNGCLGCFHFLALMKKAPSNILYCFLYRYLFSFLLDVYVGVDLLDHMVSLFSILTNCQSTLKGLQFFMSHHIGKLIQNES